MKINQNVRGGIKKCHIKKSMQSPLPFVLKQNWKKMHLLFKSPLPPLLSKGQKHFWVFYIWSKKRPEKSILPTRFEQFSLFADALLLNSLFFVCVKKKQKCWLWDTVRLSVFLSPPGDGRWHLFGWKVNSLYEISKIPHSFLDLI